MTDKKRRKKIPFHFLLWALLVSINSFGQGKSKGFTIIGETVGFADSTFIYLDDISGSNGTHMDSAYIVNNRFEYSGSIKRKTILATIETQNYSDYKFLWVENSVMNIKAEKGRFRNAAITGSKTQEKQDELDSAIAKHGNEKEQEMLFIDQNPSSIISAYILSVYCKGWGKDTTELLYGKLSKDNKESYYGRNIFKFISFNKKIGIGDKYADFSQANTQGHTVKLSDYKGKVVLLDFWASWCGPCVEENPRLVEAYKEFKDKGFEILGVSADNDKKSWLNTVKKDSLVWQNVSELNGDENTAVLIYGVSYFPSNYLIDRDGTIIAKDLRGDALAAKLKEIFK